MIIPNIASSQESGQVIPLSDSLVKDSVASYLDIAYGRQPKWKVTGAISTTGSKALRQTIAANLGNAMYGRIPGLTVVQGSGEPGYDAPGLFARGVGSYRNGNILTFVDGFEAPFDQLAAEEIETISLLKDAAAFSLYGIRGGNGVLLVTTKRGRPGAPSVDFSAQTGWQSPVRLPETLGSYQYASLYNEALRNEGKALRYSDAELQSYQLGNDPYFYPNVNWYDQVLAKTAPISNYNLIFKGGGTGIRYFLLLNVLQNEGLYKNTDPKRRENSNANFSRYNFRSNVEVNITKKLTASLNLGGRVEDRSSPGGISAVDLFNNLAATPPNAFPAYNPDGSYGGSSIYTNPIASVLNTGIDNNHSRNFQAIFKLDYDLDGFVKGLNIGGAAAFSNFFEGLSSKDRTFAVYSISRNSNGDTVYNQTGQNTALTLSEGFRDQWRRSNARFNLSYTRSFGDNDVDAMVMYLQDKYVISGNNVPFAYQNYAGRATYSFKKKYIAEFSGSYSGTDNFPSGKRFGFFPAVSAGWVASEESFIKNKHWISFLKFRASYGLVGNDQIGGMRFMYDQYYQFQDSYNFGSSNNSSGGLREGSLANPGVTWEKKAIINAGVEAILFGNLNIGLDVFSENRTDILAEPAGIPSFIGITLPAVNEGKVRNRGFELLLGYRNSESNAFQYHIEGSAWFARNKIIFMSEVLQPYNYLYQTGRSVGQPFGLVSDGFYQASDFQANGQLIAGLPVPQFGPVQPGDIKYKNQNADQVIDVYDYRSIGKPSIPEWVFGLRTAFKYKSFSVDAFFQGALNRSVYLNGTNVWAFQNNAGVTAIAMGRWTPENAGSATYPRLSTTSNENNFRFSDFWQRNGSFIKLRTLELAYSFARPLLTKIKMQSATIFANGVNLFSIDGVDIADPETLTGYPALRSVSLGLRVGL